MNELKCKRIYEPTVETGGFRILIDKLWPRGIKKENAKIDLWAKEVAPSDELRKWFSHAPEKYDEFNKRYKQELSSNSTSQKFKDLCRQKMKDHNLTLLYAAKNENCNHAIVLKEWLEEQIYQ
ncbi:MAG: DUF488 domain-containing protein [Clostridiales bacterium]|nr:DUF488 domain-containing protein [Clostridiales bacterium]MDD7432787.1 DUF488 domain-containing protein [Clostridiales bacterium]MDY3061390.1 DUF488 domain-containing protein [Eubacteriales bacterium]